MSKGTLTFGGAINENGELAFQPYTIPMGIHDVQIRSISTR